MFKRVIFPTIISLIITFLLFGSIYYYFNGINANYGDGRDQGIQFLIKYFGFHLDPEDSYDITVEFINECLNLTLYGLFLIQNFFLLFWLIVGRFLKVNKPGIARRYQIYWLIISLLCDLFLAAYSWYTTDNYDGFFYIGDEIKWFYLASIAIFGFILFYIQSILFTSKVMQVAVPFVRIFKSISFRKNK